MKSVSADDPDSAGAEIESVDMTEHATCEQRVLLMVMDMHKDRETYNLKRDIPVCTEGRGTSTKAFLRGRLA